jgi:flagellar hook assembly protein FlgD
VDSDASLVVYDVLGRRVRTLVDARMKAGDHDVVWDGRDDAGPRPD